MNIVDQYIRVMNRVAKWRTIFAGWQLGTRPLTDPECQAVRDHREVTILLRVEVNALTKLLVDKGIATHDEIMQVAMEEAERLSRDYEKKFPGARATDTGMTMDVHVARQWMQHWRP